MTEVLKPSEALALQMKDAGLTFIRELEFAGIRGRKWRFDFAFPAARLAVEVDGGIWMMGAEIGGKPRWSRHTHPKGYENDCEKLNAAILLGWKVLRFTTTMVNRRVAIQTIQKALGVEPEPSTWEEVVARQRRTQPKPPPPPPSAEIQQAISRPVY